MHLEYTETWVKLKSLQIYTFVRTSVYLSTYNSVKGIHAYLNPGKAPDQVRVPASGSFVPDLVMILEFFPLVTKFEVGEVFYLVLWMYMVFAKNLSWVFKILPWG